MPSASNAIKAALVAVAAGSVVGARILSSRKKNMAERLAECLLDVERLKDATKNTPFSSENALAGFAAYLVAASYHASEGISAAGADFDPLGYSRTHTHPYTHAAATVLTEAIIPDHLFTYAVTIPEVGEVRGTRRVGAVRYTELSLGRDTPDTAQLSLADGYTAQMESEFMTADYLGFGATRLYGSAALRDNRGNVGRLNINNDGSINGTVTRDARVIGRFEGKVAHGVGFRQYQIESAEKESG